MKKQSQRTKGKNAPKNNGSASAKNGRAIKRQGKVGSNQTSNEKPLRTIQKTPKKSPETGDGAVRRLIDKAGRFLREAKVELKKVKWPTRKELVASTVVVIVLTLMVAFYLGLVDFGLIKIIRSVVG